jgi:hypothetical protein
MTVQRRYGEFAVADIEQHTLADANCDQLRAGNGLMLLTIMPTLSQTRKQVFEFVPRLRRGQLV